MVIAIGKKSPGHLDQPQWRRPLESTVTIPMILADKKLIPNEIPKDSVLVHLADAYFHLTRRMEQRKRTASEGSPYQEQKQRRQIRPRVGITDKREENNQKKCTAVE